MQRVSEARTLIFAGTESGALLDHARAGLETLEDISLFLFERVRLRSPRVDPRVNGRARVGRRISFENRNDLLTHTIAACVPRMQGL